MVSILLPPNGRLLYLQAIASSVACEYSRLPLGGCDLKSLRETAQGFQIATARPEKEGWRMVSRKSWVSENFSPIAESRQHFYRVLQARFFLFGSEIAWVSGSDFQTRVSVSWRVLDCTIHHPQKAVSANYILRCQTRMLRGTAFSIPGRFIWQSPQGALHPSPIWESTLLLPGMPATAYLHYMHHLGGVDEQESSHRLPLSLRLKILEESLVVSCICDTNKMLNKAPLPFSGCAG